MENNPIKFRLLSCAVLFVLSSSALQADNYPGLPTRSQNPLLQSYFIPAMPVTSTQGWNTSHALYITNTYQIDSSSSEQLIIDVENTRYDLQLSHSEQLWHFNSNLSLISNRSGFMDQNIESWHDFFGLPQGGRDTAIHDQIELFYEKNGVSIVDSQQSNEGVGDIQLALGYQLAQKTQLWLGLELPAGSSNSFISNESVDLAFWLSHWSQYSDEIEFFGSGGIGLPADKGLFQNQLNNSFAFGQIGFKYKPDTSYHLVIQADYHSPIVKNSNLDALDHSLQMQFALVLPALIEDHQLDIFFSEDILPGHAPDISFSIRLSTLAF